MSGSEMVTPWEKRLIAVCGKGGSGKTALVALLTKHLMHRGTRRLLAIDADPTMNLPGVLGVEVSRTVNEVREELIREARTAGEAEKQEISRSLDYLLLDALVEADGFSMLVMGRPESLGCYCPVNDLLREGISTLAEHFDAIVIDGEAGVEQISRQVMRAVDTVLIVSDQSSRGLQTAALIRDMVQSRGLIRYRRMGLVLNRVCGGEAALREPAMRTGLELFGTVPEDEHIARLDMNGEPLLRVPEGSEAYLAAGRILEQIGLVSSEPR